ncbi:MAG: mismatch-specific DNA-glycosylase [Tuberibacillus sp.]
MESIPDHLRSGLEIIFIGFNPSLKSGETGHHYANPNNRFWNILFQSGLTPRKLSPFEDDLLLKYGYGLTNIVSRPTKAADEITKEEYQEGAVILRKKLEQYRPKSACYVGKGVYQAFSGKKQIPWGWQKDSVVQGVKDFVAPSSSGLVRMKMEEIVSIYRELLQMTLDEKKNL